MSLENLGYGLDRYKELAEVLQKAIGPEGPEGEASPGPSVKETDNEVFTMNTAEERTVAQYSVLAGALAADDLLQVEVTSSALSAQITIKVYWNNTLIDSYLPRASSGIYMSTMFELLADNITMSTFGPPAPPDWPGYLTSFVTVPVTNWRQDGGTVTVVASYGANGLTTGITTRFIKVRA